MRLALALSCASLASLALCLPLIVFLLNKEAQLLQDGFRDMKVVSDHLWEQLLHMGRDVGHLRAAREAVQAAPPGIVPEYSEEEVENLYAPTQPSLLLTLFYKSPTYGYGYTKLQCEFRGKETHRLLLSSWLRLATVPSAVLQMSCWLPRSSWAHRVCLFLHRLAERTDSLAAMGGPVCLATISRFSTN